jgi:hypothetical protein
MAGAPMPKSLGGKITITNWQPRIKNTLRGFFSARLASGMVLHHLQLHEKSESRWVGLAAREWTDEQGVKQYAKLIEFCDRATADKFQGTVLAALDRYLETLP